MCCPCSRTARTTKWLSPWVKGLRPALALPRGIGSHEESRCAEGAPRRFIQKNRRPLHGNVQRLFASSKASPQRECSASRTFLIMLLVYSAESPAFSELRKQLRFRNVRLCPKWQNFFQKFNFCRRNWRLDGEIYHHKQGRDPDYQRKETKSPLQTGSAVRAIKAHQGAIRQERA